MVKANETLKYRVGQLESSVETLNKRMYTLLTNDIPHLQSDLQSLKTRMNVLTAVNIGAIVIALLASKFL